MTVFADTKPPSDIFYLYAARGLRGFGDGFAVIILPVYLLAIGLTPQQVGIVASASLLGTASLTLLVGFVAPRFDLRRLFLTGAGMAIVTGLVFPTVETIAPVLLVAFIGTINPSAGDLGMLIPLEHSLLTQETADRDRTRVFARYSLIGSLTAAAGSLAAALPDFLTSWGFAEISALRLMFYGYASLGLLAALLYGRLPQDHMRAATHPKSALGPSRKIVYKLAALFSLDAFAGGFVVQSLLARSSYVMAVVTPVERTAAASVTAVPRSLASSISPAIAGFMLAGPFSALPLVVCGCLKIAYDVALLGMFRHTKPPEES